MLNKEKKDTISSLTSNSTRACLILGNNVTYLMKKSSYLSTENELLLRKEPVVCGCVGVWVCGCVGVWVCGGSLKMNKTANTVYPPHFASICWRCKAWNAHHTQLSSYLPN